MATAILVGGGTVSGSTSLVLDATLEVNPRLSNTVTRHPIETGSTISDHVFKNNTVIDINGLITNHSLGNRFQDQYTENREQTVHDLLNTLFEAQETISISSQYQVFENCVITSLILPRSAQIGNTLPVNMTVEQIQVVSSAFVAISPTLANAGATRQNKGQKTGVDSENDSNSTSDQNKLSRIGREGRRTAGALPGFE